MSEKFESFMKNNDEFMKIYEKIEELKERVDFLLDSELQAKETAQGQIDTSDSAGERRSHATTSYSGPR